MRILIFTLLMPFVFFQTGKAQELTPSPYFPVDTSTLSITVNTSLGNQGLFNYGDTGVYVHIGVITSLSTSSGDWRYVPFTWGTANPAAAATYVGNNQYRYTIKNIRNFFAVPAGEIIYKVAILFRNASGSLAQRNANDSDMFVPVYSGNLAGQFILPPFQPTYTPIPQPINVIIGDTLPVSFLTNGPANIQLYLNGNSIASGSSVDSLKVSIPITSAGNQQVIATASNGSVSLADTFSYYVNGITNIASLPAGVQEGINYLPGDSSAILVIYAPLKHKISVVGDFNNWVQSTAYQMNQTPDSNYFWIQLNGLQAGTEYAYQYIIDDSIRLADYNTEKVLDKSVDPSIPTATYPNLKAFPGGASGTLASIIQTGQPAYNWQVTNFQRPAKSSLRIYELLLRDFLASGNWQTLMDTLNYLKTLGINAIEVMPFNNFEGASSWGYNPNFYFAPDKVYGTSLALKQFVDACHQKGLAVLMDMVLNHSFGSSPMVQMYWDPVNNIPASNSPWFSPYYTHDYDVGYQFNNSSPATQTFRERVITYWLKNYHIDGYRFDLATGFSKINSCQADGTNCNDALWDSYDTTRINIWNALYSTEQAASPGSYCILEMFSVNNERAVYANEGMMVWNDLSYNYEQATMGYSSGWDLSGATSVNIGIPQQGIINYQGSHDDERLMYKNENFGNSNNFYNIKDTATGLKRNEMSAAFWAMVPGPKMLWQFDEMGYDYSINWCFGDSVDPSGNCRLTPKPPRWDYLLDSNRRHLHNVYASLFRLNDSFPSLASATSVNYSLSGALKVMQISTSGLNLTVLGNFDISPNTANVTFQHSGTWYNYLGSDSIIATGGSQVISLNAGAYGVYTDVNLNKVTTDTTQNPPPDTTTISGLKVNPNPVIGSSSVIQYNLAASSDVSLSLYSMVGQRIFMLDLGTQASGNHSLTFNDLPFNIFSIKSGIYILKLTSATGTRHVNISVLH